MDWKWPPPPLKLFRNFIRFSSVTRPFGRIRKMFDRRKAGKMRERGMCLTQAGPLSTRPLQNIVFMKEISLSWKRYRFQMRFIPLLQRVQEGSRRRRLKAVDESVIKIKFAYFVVDPILFWEQSFSIWSILNGHIL